MQEFLSSVLYFIPLICALDQSMITPFSLSTRLPPLSMLQHSTTALIAVPYAAPVSLDIRTLATTTPVNQID